MVQFVSRSGCTIGRQLSTMLRYGDSTYMDVVHISRFGCVKGLSMGVCVCMPACLVTGATVANFILYLMMLMGGGGFNF